MVPFPPPPPPSATVITAVEDLKAAPHVDSAVKTAIVAVAEKAVEVEEKVDRMKQWNQFLSTPIGLAVGLLIIAVLGLATAYINDKIKALAPAVVVPEAKK